MTDLTKVSCSACRVRLKGPPRFVGWIYLHLQTERRQGEQRPVDQIASLCHCPEMACSFVCTVGVMRSYSDGSIIKQNYKQQNEIWKSTPVIWTDFNLIIMIFIPIHSTEFFYIKKRRKFTAQYDTPLSHNTLLYVSVRTRSPGTSY